MSGRHGDTAILLAQKTRILDLENEIKQLKNAFESVKSHVSQGASPAFDPIESQTKNPNIYTNSLTESHVLQQIRHDQLEGSLRMLEHQVVQNMCISTAVNTQLALQVNLCQQNARESNAHLPTGVGRHTHVSMSTPLNQPVYPNGHGAPTYMGTPLIPPPSYLYAMQQSAFTPMHLGPPQRMMMNFNPYNIPPPGITAPLGYMHNMGQPVGPGGGTGAGATFLPGVPHPPRAPIITHAPTNHKHIHKDRSGNATHQVTQNCNAVQATGDPRHEAIVHPGPVNQPNTILNNMRNNSGLFIPPSDNSPAVHTLNATTRTQSDRLHLNQPTPISDTEIIEISSTPNSPRLMINEVVCEKASTPCYSLTGEGSDKYSQGSTVTPHDPQQNDQSMLCGDTSGGNQSDSRAEPVNCIKGDHHFRIPSLQKVPPDCPSLM